MLMITVLIKKRKIENKTDIFSSRTKKFEYFTRVANILHHVI